jgi:hypothetical protein
MLRWMMAGLLLAAACSGDAPEPSAKVAEPPPLQGAPGVVVACASEGATCSPAEVAKAIDEALAAAKGGWVAECEAKAEAAAEAAKAAAVEEILAEGFLTGGDVLSAGEWAGIPVRMLMGVQMCQQAAMEYIKDGRPVFLRRLEPGLDVCQDSCQAQGCRRKIPGSTDPEKANTVGDDGKGYIYDFDRLQWKVRGANSPGGYCCCVRNPGIATDACNHHDFD